MRRALARTITILTILAACTATAPSSPIPTAGPPLSIAELRYRLIDQLGPLWYCDRDFYPIAVADERDLAVKRFGEVQADPVVFATILAHLHIDSGAAITAEQKLAIYRVWKQLNAIVLEPAGTGTYRFDHLNQPAPGAVEGRRTTGTIDDRGALTIEQQAPAGQPPCPICLARGTRISTPDGELPVEAIREGMQVWSFDAAGRRVVATVLRVGRTPVPATHQMVKLVLDDGRVLHASPGHPLADGRRLATIRPGDLVDGAIVASATLEPYAGGWTFDLLPEGPTGTYLADDIPLGSTLR
jgi:hypothetical protein